jgi:hypothetical protein
MLTKTCTCEWCHWNAGVQAVVDRGVVDELQTLITDLRERLCDAEEDNAIMSAILDGTWPTASTYAEKILQIVDERRNATNEIGSV